MVLAIKPAPKSLNSSQEDSEVTKEITNNTKLAAVDSFPPNVINILETLNDTELLGGYRLNPEGTVIIVELVKDAVNN